MNKLEIEVLLRQGRTQDFGRGGEFAPKIFTGSVHPPPSIELGGGRGGQPHNHTPLWPSFSPLGM